MLFPRQHVVVDRKITEVVASGIGVDMTVPVSKTKAAQSFGQQLRVVLCRYRIVMCGCQEKNVAVDVFHRDLRFFRIIQVILLAFDVDRHFRARAVV